MRRTGWVVLGLAVLLVPVAGCDHDLTASPGSTAPDGSGATGPAAPSPQAEDVESTVPTDDPQPRELRPVQPSDPSPAPGSGARPPATGGVPGPMLERVIRDAAERARVPADRVDVTRAESVQWRDGSLGCPQPGMSYIQMIVDGYWVELVAGGRPYDYRLDGTGRFVLCEGPVKSPPFTIER